MKKLEFSIDIEAPKEKVWNTLWDEATYPQWTSVFSEGSKAVTDWKEGGMVHFLDGKGSGMYSTIAQSIPYKFMSFRHIGELKDGKELPVDEKAKEWSGSMENYTLEESGSVTKLLIDLDITDDHLKYFNETFPKALQKVKEIAEK